MSVKRNTGGSTVRHAHKVSSYHRTRVENKCQCRKWHELHENTCTCCMRIGCWPLHGEAIDHVPHNARSKRKGMHTGKRLDVYHSWRWRPGNLVSMHQRTRRHHTAMHSGTHVAGPFIRSTSTRGRRAPSHTGRVASAQMVYIVLHTTVNGVLSQL